jgi:signal transduction histidine kinase
MQSILAKMNRGKVHRPLNPREKAQAALETLRGARSVIEIADHWQVNPDDLLKWQHTLVERASSLFGDEESSASVQLGYVKLVNEALIQQIFAQIDAKEDLQQSASDLHRLIAHQDQQKEEERKRLALEIHDELGQNLLAIRIDISMLQDRTRVRHPQLHRRVGVVLANVDCAVKASRSIINDLRPFELELGLAAAVQWQMNRFERATGLAVQLSILGFDDDSASIGDAVTLSVFRTLQESLANVSQDASASCVGVTLRLGEGGVSLMVVDNGVGATRGAMSNGENFGLAGMRERASALGGHVEAEYLAGGGTRLLSWIPLPPLPA